jgi:hypothetical protein
LKLKSTRMLYKWHGEWPPGAPSLHYIDPS